MYRAAAYYYPMTVLPHLMLLLTLGFTPVETVPGPDEEILARHRVGTGTAELLDFFRRRAPDAGEQLRLRGLVRDLGDERYAVRERAAQELLNAGPAALRYLRPALQDPDLEVARRARHCVEILERSPGGNHLVVAAVRTLARRDAGPAVPALLNFLPFGGDEWVEEEILTALAACGSGGAAAAVLASAAQDTEPARRGAAGYVLGRSAQALRRDLARPLLADTDPRVRLRAAQGLAAGREKSAVPVLLALLEHAPRDVAWKAEESLFRIAGDRGPSYALGEGTAAARRQARDAWAAWWLRHGESVDLGRFAQPPQQLGLTVVAELDSNKVWEFGPDGKARWTLDKLQGPMDAQALPGNRVLVAEYQGRRVTERDLQGNVLWQVALEGNPLACRRLPNGNTFVATHNQLAEYGADGKPTYEIKKGPAFFLFGACKTPSGHVLGVTNQGTVVEMQTDGKELRTLKPAGVAGWCGVEGLPGGRILLAVMTAGKVLEVDAAGAVVWECSVAGASHASRLANGNTLVACMPHQRVVEVDRGGRVVQEVATSGRPWRAHRR